MADTAHYKSLHTAFVWLSLVTLVSQTAGQTTLNSLISKDGVTAHLCPLLCTIGNDWSCYPPFCPFPPCVHPGKYKPTDCCSYCPDGPDCKSPDGVPIKLDHWRIISGKNCTCNNPPTEADCS